MELKHFTHEHPLILNDGGKVHFCDGCKTIIRGPSYSCSKACDFYLHKSCAELPPEIQYENHEHPLFPLGREALLTCDACDSKHEGFFYTCPTCIPLGSQFFIHQDCISLPQTLKLGGHDDHNLKFHSSIPPDYSQFKPDCEICSERLNPKRPVYSCWGCRYFTHVSCAISETNQKTSQTGCKADDKVEDFVHLPVPESVSLVHHFLKNMKLEETQREELKEFTHFSHDHPLTLFDVKIEDEHLCYGSKLSLMHDIKGDNYICSGCVQRIWNSPFYSCPPCNFFVHKCCIDLPSTMQHPCHTQHPLILVQKASTPLDLFLCKYCNEYCNGFAFRCLDCEFNLDVKCGLLPCAITHEAHLQHLQLKKGSHYTRCHCCSQHKIWLTFESCKLKFECNTCNFNLHIKCALLPSTIRQKYDESHLFILTYSPIRDHPQEYLCEVCEKEINPKIWFYHCIDSDKSIHVSCTLVGDDYCNVKFGGVSNTDYHEHHLTLIRKTTKRSVCEWCRKEIKCDFVFHADSTLECSQCEFKVHLRCARERLYS